CVALVLPLCTRSSSSQGDASVPSPHNPSPAPTGTKSLPRLSHTIPPPVKPPPPIQARLPFPSNNLPLRASSSLPHQWANIHDGVKAPAYLSHPRVSRVLPSFSPLHRKNDQKSYRGAKLTTEQTIASTSPVHVKRSSPIAKKISR